MMSTAFVRMLLLTLTSLAQLVPYAIGLLVPEPRNLIVGGVQASEGRYSYAVSLKDDISGEHYCGGSLLSKSVVLTAAHCVALDENFTVVIGRHNLTDHTVGDEVTYAEKVIHPIYDMRTSVDYDIALVFLSRPTTADVDVVSFNSNMSVPVARQDVTYLGWGEIDSNDMTVNGSATLREVESNVITNYQCDAVQGIVDGTDYRDSYRGLISGAMLCTFAVGKDSCQKDSGGPLIMRGDDASTDVQVGIASWGISCASNVFPGVAARVSSAYSWIEDNVCRKSADPGPSFECGKVTEDTNDEDTEDTVVVIEIPQVLAPEESDDEDAEDAAFVTEIPEVAAPERGNDEDAEDAAFVMEFPEMATPEKADDEDAEDAAFVIEIPEMAKPKKADDEDEEDAAVVMVISEMAVPEKAKVPEIPGDPGLTPFFRNSQTAITVSSIMMPTLAVQLMLAL